MTDPQTLPRGTLTFLFTDIEGSTTLERTIGRDRYASLLARHREIVRAAWAANGGRELGTEGDSFFVFFHESWQAVAAAVAAQRALAAEPWPDDAPIRIRIGINTGDAEQSGDSYVGLGVNRAARIAAVAAGGQILVSGPTRDLYGDNPIDGVTLRDLGEHRLKDLGAPVRIFQVEADGLPADFPPLRTLDARPNNLPPQLTTFVGRDAELDEVADLLATTHLLTLTGPGGTGKTRLSLQLAARASDDFPDGVFFVPLEPVRDPMLVPPRIAAAVGIVEMAVRPVAESLADWLRDKRLLLVLDNFEQVLAAAPIVADLLRAAPDTKVIVTSRAPLHVSGEQEYPVPGLPTPPDPSQQTGLERLQQGGEAATPRPRLAWRVRRGAAVRRARRRGPARASPSRPRTPRPSRPSAPGCMACRWPSSWPPPGSRSCRRTPSCLDSTISSTSCPRVRATCLPASRRSVARSPGATTSSTRVRGDCSIGCRCS